jgi:hypothetical protein
MIIEILTCTTFVRMVGLAIGALGVGGIGYLLGRANARDEFARNRNRKWFTGDGYNVDHQTTVERR